jgi:hypothetical protein
MLAIIRSSISSLEVIEVVEGLLLSSVGTGFPFSQMSLSFASIAHSMIQQEASSFSSNFLQIHSNLQLPMWMLLESLLFLVELQKKHFTVVSWSVEKGVRRRKRNSIVIVSRIVVVV